MRTHHQKGALGAKQQLSKHTFHPNIYLFHLKYLLHIQLLEKEKEEKKCMLPVIYKSFCNQLN